MMDQSESDGRNILTLHGSENYNEMQNKNYRNSLLYRDSYLSNESSVPTKSLVPAKLETIEEPSTKLFKEKDHYVEYEYESPDHRISAGYSSTNDIHYVPISSDPPAFFFDSSHHPPNSSEHSPRPILFSPSRSRGTPEQFYGYHTIPHPVFVPHSQISNPNYSNFVTSSHHHHHHNHQTHGPHQLIAVLPEHATSRSSSYSVAGGTSTQKIFESPNFNPPDLIVSSSASATVKTKSGAKNNPRDINRKTTHNEVERRRRDKINTCMERMMQMIPCSSSELKNSNSSIVSKFNILNRACEYIEHLTAAIEDDRVRLDEMEGLRSTLDQVLAENERLSQENESLKKRLKSRNQLSANDPSNVISNK